MKVKASGEKEKERDRRGITDRIDLTTSVHKH